MIPSLVLDKGSWASTLRNVLNYRDKLGKLGHPTEEHLIPLFYFLGSLHPEERVKAEVLHDGFEFGSVSLLSFVSSLLELDNG